MSTDEELLTKLKAFTTQLYSIQKQVINNLNISSSEYKVLSMLSFHEELSQSALSDLCYMDKPATSRIIRKMNTSNLINKKKKVGNKKIVYISLSDKGKLLANKILNEYQEARKKQFENLNESDKLSLIKLIDKVLIEN